VQLLHKRVTGFGAERGCVVFSLLVQVVRFRMERPKHDDEAARLMELQMWKFVEMLAGRGIHRCQKCAKEKRQRFYAGV